MVVVACTIPGCEFKTQDVSESLAIALLGNHTVGHTTSSQSAPPLAPSRGPKLTRPTIDIGVSIEEWNIFLRRWEVFKAGSGIGEASAPSQLFQCAGADLGDRIMKTNPTITSESITAVLATMRSLAVIPVATCVLGTELLQLQQERDETFRAFTARVRGKAETCAFNARCECGQDVDYTDHVVRDVLLNGLSDPDIRRDVLGTKDILTKPINDVIALVENKEIARNALPSASLSSISTFKQTKQAQPTTPPSAPVPTQSDRDRVATCPDCKTSYKIFTEGARGWNTKPHKVCINCYRARRRNQRQRHSPQASTAKVQAVESDPISQLAAFQAIETPLNTAGSDDTPPTHRSVSETLSHHIFSKGEWRRARLRDHPRVPLTIELDTRKRTKDSASPCAPLPLADVSAIVDTGAQSDLWALSDFLACGFSRDHLHPIRMSLSAANRSPIAIEGAFFAKLSTKSPDGRELSYRSMVYVSSSVQDMYLSYESLLNLGLLANGFPGGNSPPKHHQHAPGRTPPVNATSSLNDGCDAPPILHGPACSCPQRQAPPPRPSELPFPCTPENNARMKAWLLQRYGSSTFNTCPHRPLPRMDGPPIEIHMEATATPKCDCPSGLPELPLVPP